MKRRVTLRPALCLLLTCLSQACVTVYQPLASLHRPVAVDPQLPNFEGERLLVRCFPSEYVAKEHAELLCRNVRTLFTRQGAQVDTEVPQGGVAFRDETTAASHNLVMNLSARLLQEDNSGLLWTLSILTGTLVPAITDSAFAQDVVIKDDHGVTLASETLQGRFVRYFGLGVWAVNGVLDLLVRSKEDKLTGDGAQQDFSRDFYAQLSQLAFHAHMRAWVLRGFEPEPPRRKP